MFFGTFQYNYNTGINYETLGPEELRSLLTTVYFSLFMHWLHVVHTHIQTLICTVLWIKVDLGS